MSGPSGVGKGTVVRQVLRRDPSLVYSVSATTRPPRAGEVDGRDYRFLSEEEFARRVAAGEFLARAEVFGRHYGTLSGPVEAARRDGSDVLLEVDVQGAEQVRRRAPDAVLIFLRPPSIGELERRLRSRGTESEERIEARLATAADEMARAETFDHVVENRQVDRAVDEVLAIIERYRRAPRSPRPDDHEPPEGTPSP